ncbi:mucin [Sarocladium implicatum]|nr:mucin [Sarocladium implicatum]
MEGLDTSTTEATASATDQSRKESFWWTPEALRPPISACGGLEDRSESASVSSDGPCLLYHGSENVRAPRVQVRPDASANTAYGNAQPRRHGHASKRRRPEMKTFLDLDALSTRSNTTSRLSSARSAFRLGRPHSDDFDATVFLFSGRSSLATTSATAVPEPAKATNVMEATSTDTASRAAGADATTLHHSALRELRDLELMQDTDFGTPDRGRQRHRDTSNHHLRVFDHFPADQRPSSSRSHLRYWHRSKSPVPDASKYLRVSSDGSSPSINNLPSMTITRDEFESLPPTIQRKYFSTIERLHIAQNPALLSEPPSTLDLHPTLSPLGLDDATCKRPSVLTTLSDSTTTGSGHLRINSTEQKFYANLPEKIKRRHLSKEEQLVARSRQTRRRSLSVGAADDFVKPKHRPSLRALGVTNYSIGSTVSLIEELPKMQPESEARASASIKPHAAEETFFDNFRWLEDEDDLDLRLFLDDYHINLRDEVPLPSKSRRPSFRRHLSVSKLPFGRANLSTTRLSISSRTGVTSPTTAKSPSIASEGFGHARKKSRALSLVSGNRQQPPSTANAADPAAAHYQDPEARLRLREYLGSSTKFDEALEYGFPSMEERPIQPGVSHLNLSFDFDKPRTFLDDEDKSSCSDDGSVADPESPRTPRAFDKSTAEGPPALTAFPISESKTDFLQAPLSARDMTLRMTLTRPDLRANEEQMYGWQKNALGRPYHSRAGSKAPTILVRDISPKESIEKQFAVFDQENMAATNDNGVVKRFWKRVRRS